MREADASQVLRLAISARGDQSHICYLNDPKLRYLTKEQAEQWIKIGTYTNVCSTSGELQLVSDNLSEILMGVIAPITLIDLGCGDGRKGAQFISQANRAGCSINRYLAIDINNNLIETAISRVVSSTDLHRENCSSICTPFEELTTHNLAQHHLENPRSLIYIFFGNTFNNFEKNDIVHLLGQILRPHEKLLIGARCRKTSDKNEEQRLIAEHSTYGSGFIFSVGHLLGVLDGNMHKLVKYNSALHRIEVWLEIDHPSPSMVAMGIANVHQILVICSYKPTMNEACESLSLYFNVIPFSNRDATEVIYLCERKESVS